MIIAIAGHRQGRCCRHQYSGFWHLTVTVTGPGPLIPVLDWVSHRPFCSLRYWTDRMPDSLAFLLWIMKVERYTSSTSKLQVVARATPCIHACCWCFTWCMMLLKNHNKLPECPGKGKSGIANFSPASAFWHQGRQVPLVTDESDVRIL